VARPVKTLASHDVHFMLPEDLYIRLQLHLYRESARRVPIGAFQTFFIERIKDFFGSRASAPLPESARREAYLGLETIFATATKRGAKPEEALRAIARWSRLHADKLLEDPPK
jgi:hypothetical protein